MLTRLKVSGFKNLVDIDVEFGPFTCVAGANGTGKSNLFDAIQFLSALANDSLMNAALSVRAETGKTTDVRNLFHRVGNKYDEEMSFEAEMIVPYSGKDDLGQRAEAKITFLRYSTKLVYREDETLLNRGSLELVHEELTHINKSDAPKHLHFKPSRVWRNSVVRARGRRSRPFIATVVDENNNRIVKLHQDGNQGRPRTYLAANLPRTILSSVNAIESPTALLAKREIQSWRLLQLEPSALREPDEFTTPSGLGIDGSHLPATLDYLARSFGNGNSDNSDNDGMNTWVYDQVAERLSELIDDVGQVQIDRDERRQLLTLEVQDRGGTTLPARSLSAGTLRFLALAVLALDPNAQGVICLEEPENGIHPERIPAMLQLLQDIAVDSEIPTNIDNPLRQVIINTHSPSVVKQVPDESLLISELKELIQGSRRFKSARFSWLPDTWRQHAHPDIPTLARGRLLAYLNPADNPDYHSTPDEQDRRRRVIDRPDILQLILPGVDQTE